jgi:hypothetical protein
MAAPQGLGEFDPYFEVYTIGMHGPHYDITPRQWRFVQEYLVDRERYSVGDTGWICSWKRSCTGIEVIKE